VNCFLFVALRHVFNFVMCSTCWDAVSVGREQHWLGDGQDDGSRRQLRQRCEHNPHFRRVKARIRICFRCKRPFSFSTSLRAHSRRFSNFRMRTPRYGIRTRTRVVSFQWPTHLSRVLASVEKAVFDRIGLFGVSGVQGLPMPSRISRGLEDK
jgi:hypothetical protein